MDFRKIVGDVSARLSRAVQVFNINFYFSWISMFHELFKKTEETFLSAEKTEYDMDYKIMLDKIDLLSLWTERFVKEATAALEPNISI